MRLEAANCLKFSFLKRMPPDPTGGIFLFMNDLEQSKIETLIPIVETMPADLLTPLAVYLKLAKDEPNSFLLESVEGGETLARYSFIGAGPKMIVSGDDRMVTVTNDEETESIETSLMSFLRGHFAGARVEQDSTLPSFVGGAIGFLGFDAAGWFEPSVRNGQTDHDTAAFMFFTSVVAFDHAKQVIQIISLASVSDSDGDIKSACENSRANNARIRNILETVPVSLPAARCSAESGDINSNWTEEGFKSGVERIKELILAGECYQVVLSQCFSKKTTASPVSIYRAVRSLNPSPYMFLLQFGERSVIGASPEMLVRSRGNELEYRPIAGTRPRSIDPAEDQRLAEEMRSDKKEVAEHLMLVDLGRNDLGRVAEFGSVDVTSLMHVEKYSHVQHLVSSIKASLRPGLDRFDALAACFPAGTVSGAPKVRAIEVINEMEPTLRGVYAGAVGYFDYAGNMDTCIAIRTMTLENGEAKVQAGAGIVADSVPAAEYQETINKAKAMLKAIEIAEGGGL